MNAAPKNAKIITPRGEINKLMLPFRSHTMPSMLDLLIRNLSPEVESLLREKAIATGISISDLAKALISKGVLEQSAGRGLGTEIRNLLSDQDFSDLEIPPDSIDFEPAL